MEIEPSIGYINAGGRGTRLNGLFVPNPETGIAKALLEIGNPSIKLIDHHIANLRQQNIEKVVVAAGDQTEVCEYIHDIYEGDKGIQVTRSLGQLGTGGDLTVYARESGLTDPIIVQNVDTILDINFRLSTRHFMFSRQLGAQACIALTLNKDVPNEGAFVGGTDDMVMHSAEFCDEALHVNTDNSIGYQGSSTGAVIVDPDFLRHQNWREQDGQLSLYRQTLRQAWQVNSLYAYNNEHGFFRDVGTVATWLDSKADLGLQSLLRYNQRRLIMEA